MQAMVAINEVFAIRDGETMRLCEEIPDGGRWLGVMARSVEMPLGSRQQKRHDGLPVESAAILACQRATDGNWQWVNLSPATKENVGDLLFTGGLQRDHWYFLEIE